MAAAESQTMIVHVLSRTGSLNRRVDAIRPHCSIQRWTDSKKSLLVTAMEFFPKPNPKPCAYRVQIVAMGGATPSGRTAILGSFEDCLERRPGERLLLTPLAE